MPPTHVEQLFSAAYDEMLSEREAERFRQHIRDCGQCAAGYEAFRASVDAVRALPQARMPQKVHLPSTSPVAEVQPLWRRPPFNRPQLRFGGATAVAFAGAVAIFAVALLHPSTTNTRNGSPGALSANGATGGTRTSACHPQAAALAAAPPAGYEYRNAQADVQRPGQQLVVATTTSQVSAGSDVIVFAQLTVTVPEAAAPGATRASPIGTAVIPCLSVTGPGGASYGPAATGPYADQAPAVEHGLSGLAPQATTVPGLAPLLEFTVPPGTPPGTVIEVVASIPAGYPSPGDPPLTVRLPITVR
ncbi:MAG: hypothetical protein E6J45_10225 [Chloroflexi bacterium]|nr:MAG: hypothetical protein E6J45_10225 [Chloroflexota bacterium]